MTGFSKLVRYSSHHLVGRVVGLALGFASFPVFTRLFSVSDYGRINLVLQSVLIFTVLSKAGLQNSVQRFELELTRGTPTERQRFFCTIFIGNAAIALTCGCLFLIGVLLLPASQLPPAVRNIALLGAVLVVARAVRAMYGNMLQIEGKTVLLNVLEVSVKAASIAAVCLFAFGWQKTSAAFFFGLALVEGGTILALLPDLSRRMGKSIRLFDFALLRRLVVFGLPLMWAELAWVILDSGNRFIVQIFQGTAAVGYFAAAYNIGAYVQEVVLTPLNFSFFPVCMDLWTNQGEDQTRDFIRRSLSYFVMFACGIVAITLAISGDAIVVLASRKYLQAHVLLPWLIAGLSACTLQIFFRTGLLLRNLPSKVAHATTVAAVFNVVLNLILVPRIGILGAAVTAFLSYLLWIVLMAWASHKVFPICIEYGPIVRYLACGAVTALVAGHVFLSNTVLRLLVRALVGLTCYAGLILLLDTRIRALVSKLLTRGLLALRSLRDPELRARIPANSR
ncbi:hypothetical protein DYQ86_20575 [Acidobacteria bacterium AB60]|nr:hypothetical protein DYQ86_20575 [Acidobacteria bacterium AB60]